MITPFFSGRAAPAAGAALVALAEHALCRTISVHPECSGDADIWLRAAAQTGKRARVLLTPDALRTWRSSGVFQPARFEHIIERLLRQFANTADMVVIPPDAIPGTDRKQMPADAGTWAAHCETTHATYTRYCRVFGAKHVAHVFRQGAAPQLLKQMVAGTAPMIVLYGDPRATPDAQLLWARSMASVVPPGHAPTARLHVSIRATDAQLSTIAAASADTDSWRTYAPKGVLLNLEGALRLLPLAASTKSDSERAESRERLAVFREHLGDMGLEVRYVAANVSARMLVNIIETKSFYLQASRTITRDLLFA